MRKIYCIILCLAVVMALFPFPTPVYAGGQDGAWDQVHVAIFSESNGEVGDQIGGDDEAYTVDPGAKLFVVIQANFITLSKDQDIEISWREWAGTWAVASQKGTNSDTVWEFWDSDYASEETRTIHFTGSDAAMYLEDQDQDAEDPEGLEEFWFVVEAPTTEIRYELALSEDGVVENSQGTISQQISITLEQIRPAVSTQAASSIGDNSATLNGEITDVGDDVTCARRGFDWGLTDSYGSEWIDDTGGFGTGTFNHGISGLDTGTTYHFRAKAENSHGWGYGSDETFKTTGIPTHPYLQIVQGAPEKGTSVWWEWIVVNPTDSSKTCTEVRVKEAGVDWNWTIDVQGYPDSGWADGGADGLYWSGSESIPAHSAKVFRVRAIQGNIKSTSDHTLTWSATVGGVSVDRTSTCVGIDRSSGGGMFYNKPGDTTEQSAGVHADGLYTYLDEDSSSNPLEAGTEYTFYVNVHEWAGKGIDAGGELTITIPGEFTNVTLIPPDDYADFSDASVSGGGTADWTISGTNDAAISDSVDHLSFKATTPTGYAVDTNWEFDTRFTGTGDKGETVRYICEANVKITTIISITVSDGVVAYGTLTPGATQDTVTLGDTQTATNNGNVAEKFHIKSSNAVGGTNWTLGSSQGDNTFTHKASIDGGSSWTPMTEAGTYYELAASVPAEGYQDFDLQIGMPTIIDDYTEKTITVTILATAA